MLPGLDTILDEEAWNAIGGGKPVDDRERRATPAPSHPQYAMHGLLKLFGIKRSNVGPLADASIGRSRDTDVRDHAAVHDHERNGIGTCKRAQDAREDSAGMTGVAVIEAADPEMEALAIAVAMREARELNKSAALVTPDRAWRDG